MSSFELRHPQTDLLLQLLDGELGGRQARQVRRHVEACWQCRTALDDLQKTVAECVRYRKEALGELLPAPPRPWSDLSREFARIDATRPPLLARPMMRWALTAVAASSLVAATLAVRATLFPPAEIRIEHHTPQPAPPTILGD
jgi:anti-sigma factor RsiW